MLTTTGDEMDSTKNKEKLVQRTLFWWTSEKDKIAAKGTEEEGRTSALHETAKKLLRESASDVVRESES